MVARKRLNDRLVLVCAYFDICYKYQYYFTRLNIIGFFFRLVQISALQLLWEYYTFFFLILSSSVGFLMEPTVQAAASVWTRVPVNEANSNK
jgi:hypothetical protein